MDNQTNHISKLRHLFRMTMAVYADKNTGVSDEHLMGALAAVLCEAIVLREVQLEDALEAIRKTYEHVQTEMAMLQKADETVQ